MGRTPKVSSNQILEAVRTLSARGPVTAPQLAEELDIHRSNLYKALEGLVERGELERQAVGDKVHHLRLPQRGFPILGGVSAGHGILADGSIQDYLLDLREAFGMDEQHDFFLQVEGDSMSGVGIRDSDLVAIRRSNTAKEGEIVLALIPDEELGLLKTFYRGRDWIELRSENPHFETRRLAPEAVLIQGTYLGHLSSMALRKRFGKK
jgi:repressor LexA